jgi:predicted nucleic acid-binding protein
VIVDASVVTAALVETTDRSDWARATLAVGGLAGPHLMPAEVCQVLRRLVAAGVLAADSASLAVGRLVELRTELHAFEPYADRVWELRDTVSAYDAWYVALAEAHDVPFATMDDRLARAVGPRCVFLVPGAGGPP